MLITRCFFRKNKKNKTPSQDEPEHIISFVRSSKLITEFTCDHGVHTCDHTRVPISRFVICRHRVTFKRNVRVRHSICIHPHALAFAIYRDFITPETLYRLCSYSNVIEQHRLVVIMCLVGLHGPDSVRNFSRARRRTDYSVCQHNSSPSPSNVGRREENVKKSQTPVFN